MQLLRCELFSFCEVFFGLCFMPPFVQDESLFEHGKRIQLVQKLAIGWVACEQLVLHFNLAFSCAPAANVPPPSPPPLPTPPFPLPPHRPALLYFSTSSALLPA